MRPIAPRAGGAALFWVVAIACLLAGTAVLASMMADRTQATWDGALRSNVIARIVSPDAPSALEGATLALNAIEGVNTVRIVTPERAIAVLRSLGVPDITASDLPTPRLITFNVDAPPTPEWARSIEARLAQAGFTTEIYGPGPNVRRGAEEAVKQANAARAIGALLAGAALLTIGLAGRARAAHDRAVIAPLADMGATRGQVGGAFATRSAIEGFLGGALGTLAVMAPLWWLLQHPADFGAPFNEWAGLLEWKDALPLGAAPLLAALLAAGGARSASTRVYEQAARRR